MNLTSWSYMYFLDDKGQSGTYPQKPLGSHVGCRGWKGGRWIDSREVGASLRWAKKKVARILFVAFRVESRVVPRLQDSMYFEKVSS